MGLQSTVSQPKHCCLAYILTLQKYLLNFSMWELLLSLCKKSKMKKPSIPTQSLNSPPHLFSSPHQNPPQEIQMLPPQEVHTILPLFGPLPSHHYFLVIGPAPSWIENPCFRLFSNSFVTSPSQWFFFQILFKIIISLLLKSFIGLPLPMLAIFNSFFLYRWDTVWKTNNTSKH